MADLKDNTGEVSKALSAAMARALETIGMKAETYAKQRITDLHAVDTGALRNSITHAVQGDGVIVGSNIHYAPYIELGTGREYSPPPEWMENNAPQGAGLRGGIKPRPFLRPAVEEHRDEYQKIVQDALKNG